MKGIDIFAGLGGLSEGARQAGVTMKWAGNHWRLACDWYEANHGLRPVCQDLQQADFREAPAHDLLLAAPACQGHTSARGKERPHHDAQRATAWAVVSCAEVHRSPVVVVENVKEFAKWTLYPAWCAAMHALGYALSPMIIDAADHGVAQHRVRMIIVATRSRHPLQLTLPWTPHRTAREVIDFGAGNWSLIRKPGRRPSTLRRARAGHEAFGPQFLAPFYGSGSGKTGRSLDRPIGTITTKARWAVYDGDRMRMVTKEEGREFMGFPATYRLPKKDEDAWHLLGNAVCPPMARDLILALRRAA